MATDDRARAEAPTPDQVHADCDHPAWCAVSGEGDPEAAPTFGLVGDEPREEHGWSAGPYGDLMNVGRYRVRIADGWVHVVLLRRDGTILVDNMHGRAKQWTD